MAKGKGHNGRDGDGSRDYPVGYRKPPVHSRFRAGKSGNPKGRPKGRKNNATLVAAILRERVTLNGPSGPRTVSLKEALIYKQAEQGLKGDGRAVRTLFDIEEKGTREHSTPDVERLSADDEALFNLILRRNRHKTEGA